MYGYLKIRKLYCFSPFITYLNPKVMSSSFPRVSGASKPITCIPAEIMSGRKHFLFSGCLRLWNLPETEIDQSLGTYLFVRMYGIPWGKGWDCNSRSLVRDATLRVKTAGRNRVGKENEPSMHGIFQWARPRSHFLLGVQESEVASGIVTDPIHHHHTPTPSGFGNISWTL